MKASSDIRIPNDANTYLEVLQYYSVRAMQFAAHQYGWSGIVTPHEHGFLTHFYDARTKYASFYVPEAARGNGLTAEVCKAIDLPFLTIKECNVWQFLESIGAEVKVFDALCETPEYAMISRIYGDRKSKRGKQFLMNHIDEGAALIAYLSKATTTPNDILMKAWALHPVLQDNEPYMQNMAECERTCDPRAVELAIRYRQAANMYLSGIYRGPNDLLPEFGEDVGILLIADKVQNYKDMQMFNRHHPKYQILSGYFENWLNVLSISQEEFLHLTQMLVDITAPKKLP